MAREFILFIHIYHWIGEETAVPFKTSPGLLTECHGDKMNTSGKWRGGAGAAPPGVFTDLAVGCFFLFLPGTQTF